MEWTNDDDVDDEEESDEEGHLSGHGFVDKDQDEENGDVRSYLHLF